MVPVQAQWLLCDGTGLFDSYQIISFLTRVSQGVCFPLSIFIDTPPPPSSLPLPISTFSLLSSIFLSSLLPYITPSRAATRPEYRCRCQMDRWESPWFLAKIQTPAFPLFSYTWAATEIHTRPDKLLWRCSCETICKHLNADKLCEPSFCCSHRHGAAVSTSGSEHESSTTQFNVKRERSCFSPCFSENHQLIVNAYVLEAVTHDLSTEVKNHSGDQR